MIILGHSVSHIGNLVNYIFKEEKQHVFLSSDGLDITSANSIMSDFALYDAPSKRLKKKFLSLVVSPDNSDNVSINDFKEIVNDVIKELGLTQSQYVAVLHTNTHVNHAHILVSRVKYDNTVINDSHIGLNCMKAADKIAKKHNFTSAKDIREENAKRFFKSNPDVDGLTPRGEAKDEINRMVKEVLHKNTTQSVDDIFDHLMNFHNLEVSINKFKNGMLGVKLKYGEFTFKSSEINRFLSVQPDGESYKANNSLQFILDRNIARFEGRRSTEEVLKDIGENPHMQELLAPEIRAITDVLRISLQSSRQSRKEEYEDMLLQRKGSKKPKQIGFKVQI